MFNIDINKYSDMLGGEYFDLKNKKIWQGEEVLTRNQILYRGLCIPNKEIDGFGLSNKLKEYTISRPSFWADTIEAAKNYSTWRGDNKKEDHTCFIVETKIIKDSCLFARYKMYPVFRHIYRTERKNGNYKDVHVLQAVNATKLASNFSGKNYNGVIDTMSDIVIEDHSIHKICCIKNISQNCVVDTLI